MHKRKKGNSARPRCPQLWAARRADATTVGNVKRTCDDYTMGLISYELWAFYVKSLLDGEGNHDEL